jgi:hypothetical protein
MSIFSSLPYWVGVVSISVALLLVLEVAYRLGWSRLGRGQNASGEVVVSSLLALTGLLIAFTYGFTVSHYEARKRTVIDEANAIGTAFLKADLMSEPGRGELRSALLDYARSRVATPETAGTPELLAALLERTLEAQGRLWPATAAIVEADGPGPLQASLVGTITDLMDLHTTRIAISFDRLPGVVFALLLFLVATSLALAGYDAGSSGRRARLRLSAFALVLAAVVLTVLDFDNTVVGLINVDQGSLETLISNLEAEIGR